jgi:hypothetical protein
MDGKGRATDNIMAERFSRSYKWERLYLLRLETVKESKAMTKDIFSTITMLETTRDWAMLPRIRSTAVSKKQLHKHHILEGGFILIIPKLCLDKRGHYKISIDDFSFGCKSEAG